MARRRSAGCLAENAPAGADLRLPRMVRRTGRRLLRRQAVLQALTLIPWSVESRPGVGQAGVTEPGLPAGSHSPCSAAKTLTHGLLPCLFVHAANNRAQGRGEPLQHRRNENDVANKVNVEDPAKVRDSVLSLFTARYP